MFLLKLAASNFRSLCQLKKKKYLQNNQSVLNDASRIMNSRYFFRNVTEKKKTGVEMRLEFETHKHIIFAFPNINPERVTEKDQA